MHIVHDEDVAHGISRDELFCGRHGPARKKTESS